MAKKDETEAPTNDAVETEVPWSDAGREVVEPGIGTGFVEWRETGNSIRGRLGPRWQSRAMKSAAVTIELSEKPKVRVVNTEGTGKTKVLRPKKGELVNVSLSFDLARKLTPDLEGCEVGLLYSGDQDTPKGSMRVFKVYHFEQSDLPF